MDASYISDALKYVYINLYGARNRPDTVSQQQKIM